MKKYDNYKDSGIEWIGKIPSHWELTRIKYKYKIGRGRVISNEDLVDDAIYPVFSSQTLNNGCLGYIDTYDFDYKLITWTTDGANAGTVFLREGKFNCTNVCGTLKAKSDETIPEFDFYFLQYATQFYKRPDTNGAKIMNNEMAVILSLKLSIEEQYSIANYLDFKTSQIDTLVYKKQQFITLLQEERIAVINQAVTKGLDSNVKMKDSSIDWLGEIPEHWKTARLNQIIKVKDGTHESPTQISKNETAFPLITSKDFKNGEINFENAKYISKEDHENTIKRSNTEKGDIIMSMIGGNIGNLVYVQTDREFSIKNVCLFKTSFNTIYAKHLYYILKSPLLKIQIDLCSRGGAQGFLSLGDLRSLVYFVLPEKEIESIVLHIENEEIRIETLIAKFQQEIELLKEYKTALISEVVTGKVDVRGEVLN